MISASDPSFDTYAADLGEPDGDAKPLNNFVKACWSSNALDADDANLDDPTRYTIHSHTPSSLSCLDFDCWLPVRVVHSVKSCCHNRKDFVCGRHIAVFFSLGTSTGRDPAACTCSRRARSWPQTGSHGRDGRPRRSCSTSGHWCSHGSCGRSLRMSSTSGHLRTQQHHRHRRHCIRLR